jgi:hypothetical protein
VGVIEMRVPDPAEQAMGLIQQRRKLEQREFS